MVLYHHSKYTVYLYCILQHTSYILVGALLAGIFWIVSTSNLLLYSLYYAETCNEFVRPICSRTTQLLLKKCRSGGEPLATQCSIWPARDLNLRLPAPEVNLILLEQVQNKFDIVWEKARKTCTFWQRWWTKLCFGAENMGLAFSLIRKISAKNTQNIIIWIRNISVYS